ncbi:MAG: c-type cytochrome [Alphaproteobacteria bacterium]
MNAFEINKIVGAVLMTALIVSVISLAGNSLVPEGGAGGAKHAPAAATAGHAGATSATGGAGAAVKKPQPEASVANLLAQASLEAGKKAVKKCLACHSLNKGGANKIGPNLYGIVGRNKGAHPGYNYSSGMKGAGGVWGYAELFAFLKKPSAFVKGTKMSFRIKKPKARADLLVYLRTLSDSPVPLPQPAPASSGN